MKKGQHREIFLLHKLSNTYLINFLADQILIGVVDVVDSNLNFWIMEFSGEVVAKHLFDWSRR
jgi:hypothetical protein